MSRRRVKSLGPSNDDPPEVQVEMRAAEIARSARGKPGCLRGEDEASGNCDHFTGGDLADEDPRGWLAGWLSAEIRSHDARDQRDATAWAWDTSRPIAGQYEEHAGLQHEAADAEVDDHPLAVQLAETAAAAAADDREADALVDESNEPAGDL